MSFLPSDPNSYVEVLTTNVTAFGDKHYLRKSSWLNEAYSNRNSVHIRGGGGDIRNAHAQRKGHNKYTAKRWPSVSQEEDSLVTNLASTFTLAHQPLYL